MRWRWAIFGALVNRTRELSLLREVWELAVETSSCQQVTLIGVAGMGKSRLAEEMCRTVAQDAGVLRGRCLNYGEGVTFRPLIEALSSASDPESKTRELVTAVQGEQR